MSTIARIAIVAAIPAFIAYKRMGTRAVKRHSQDNTWSNAADTRYPRYPRPTIFGRKRGMN